MCFVMLVEGNVQLSEIGGAVRPACRFPRLLTRGQKNGGNGAQNGEDDDKLNLGERSPERL